jgi:hypothetical protein
MQNKISEKIFSVIFLIFISIGVILYTLWQSQYILDPHHWGLMLGNARDITLGLLPYKDIYIQYGILTTIIHAVGYYIYPNLLMLMLFTALCYSVAIGILFAISRLLLKSYWSSIFFIVIIFLYHPLAIYPWSNYIAYPFLLAGIFLLIKDQNYRSLLLSGLFFSLAVLSREGLLPAIALIVFYNFYLNLFKLGDKVLSIKYLGIQILGFSIFPIIFFCYLYLNDLIYFWSLLSIQLPKIYTGYFPHVRTLQIFSPLVGTIIGGAMTGDIRWVITLLTVTVCFIYFLYSILNQSRSDRRLCIIAVAALAMLSSAIHIPEIFRLATGSILGLILVFSIFTRFWWFKLIAILGIFFLIKTVLSVSSSNPYYPTDLSVDASIEPSSLIYFSGQKWSADKVNFYNALSYSLNELDKDNCGLKYQYNGTMDSFFQVLSPFKQIQIAPFTTWDNLNNLRPDLKFKEKITQAEDIVLIYSLNKEDLISYKVPDNFFIYQKLSIPNIIFLPANSTLVILAPIKCKK